jgi:16S rRNA G966 N2-methylase RsmD
MRSQVRVKGGMENIFVSSLNNQILLSIYAGNGSMGALLTKEEAKQVIEAIKEIESSLKEVTA